MGQSSPCPLGPWHALGDLDSYALLPPTRARTLPSFFLFLLLMGFFISWRLLIISRRRKGISCSSWFLGLLFTLFFSWLRGRTRG